MREYYYLIASLPMLEFGMEEPLSYSEFLTRCEEQLSPSDFKIIKRASPEEWKHFDATLRNEIAKSRAIKYGKDSAKYIRGEDLLDPFIAMFAHWVTSQGDPLEAELSLDRYRWEKLEEMQKGHYFDIEFLVIYALKLQILERWQRIHSGGGMEVLEELTTGNHRGTETQRKTILKI